MKISLKLKNNSSPWSINLRPKVNEVVSLNGNYFQNTTGKNSNPDSVQTDWTFVGKEEKTSKTFIKYGKRIVFKAAGNPNESIQEIGDFCQGFVEGQFINADYLGPDEDLLTSYNI